MRLNETIQHHLTSAGIYSELSFIIVSLQSNQSMKLNALSCAITSIDGFIGEGGGVTSTYLPTTALM
jgi:hypothetical protein